MPRRYPSNLTGLLIERQPFRLALPEGHRLLTQKQIVAGRSRWRAADCSAAGNGARILGKYIGGRSSMDACQYCRKSAGRIHHVDFSGRRWIGYRCGIRIAGEYHDRRHRLPRYRGRRAPGRSCSAVYRKNEASLVVTNFIKSLRRKLRRKGAAWPAAHNAWKFSLDSGSRNLFIPRGKTNSALRNSVYGILVAQSPVREARCGGTRRPHRRGRLRLATSHDRRHRGRGRAGRCAANRQIQKPRRGLRRQAQHRSPPRQQRGRGAATTRACRCRRDHYLQRPAEHRVDLSCGFPRHDHLRRYRARRTLRAFPPVVR